MIKKLFLGFFGLCIWAFFGCAELQQIANQIPNQGNNGLSGLSNLEISNGLKQALEFGLNEGVSKLTKKNGYFNNELTRILLPKELKKVDKTLRQIGLGKLADEGLKILNTAATDAVVEAKPIFLNAIKGMSFADAKNILLGNDNAATNFLKSRTSQQLSNAFLPKITKSLDKVGANQIWGQITNKYNAIAAQPVNPDLNTYVTEQAINGLFNLVAEKEKGIRNNVGMRSTDLLRKVFSKQDKTSQP